MSAFEFDLPLREAIQQLYDAASTTARHAAISAIIDFVKNNQDKESQFRVVRIVDDMIIIPTVEHKMEKTVTFVLNRLKNGLGSSETFVRENVTCGLEVLLSVWLRTKLIDSNSLIAVSQALNRLPSKFPPKEKNNAFLGQLFGYRTLIEVEASCKQTNTDFAHSVWSGLASLLRKDQFLVFGGALLADILSRSLIRLNFNKLNPSTQSIIQSVLGEFRAALNKLASLPLPNDKAMEKSSDNTDHRMNLKMIYYPAAVFVLKLAQYSNDAKKSVSTLPPSATDLVKFALQHAEALSRAIIHRSMTVSYSNVTQLAAIWSILQGTLTRWEYGNKDLTAFPKKPTHYLLDSIAEMTVGENKSIWIRHMALKHFLDTLVWAKAGKAYAHLAKETSETAKAFSNFNLEEFYVYAFTSEQVAPLREHWLQALCFKRHCSAELATFGVRIIESIFSDKSLNMSSLWNEINEGNKLSNSTDKKKRNRQTATSQSQDKDSLTDSVSPVAFLDIIDHFKEADTMNDTGDLSVISEENLFRKTFSTPIDLSKEHRLSIIDVLKSDIGRKKILPSKLVLRLFSAFQQTDLSALPSHEEKFTAGASDQNLLNFLKASVSQLDSLDKLAVWWITLLKALEKKLNLKLSPPVTEWLHKSDVGQQYSQISGQIKPFSKEEIASFQGEVEKILVDALNGSGCALNAASDDVAWQHMSTVLRILQPGDKAQKTAKGLKNDIKSDKLKITVCLELAGLIQKVLAHVLGQSSQYPLAETLGEIISKTDNEVDIQPLIETFLALLNGICDRPMNSVWRTYTQLLLRLFHQLIANKMPDAEDTDLDPLWGPILGESIPESFIVGGSDAESEDEEDEAESGENNHDGEMVDDLGTKDVDVNHVEAEAGDDDESDVELTDLMEITDFIGDDSSNPVKPLLAQSKANKNEIASTLHRKRKGILSVIMTGLDMVCAEFEGQLKVEDCEKVVGKACGLFPRVMDLLTVLKIEDKEGQKKKMLEGVWQRNQVELVEKLLYTCRVLLNQISKLISEDSQTAKRLLKASGNVVENCLIMFIKCVQTGTHVVHRLLPKRELEKKRPDSLINKQLKLLATLIDVLGQFNDKLILTIASSKFTPQRASELLNVQTEEEASVIKSIWSLQLKDLITYHPNGIRCSKCSVKRLKHQNQHGSTPTCYTLSHIDAALACIGLDSLSTSTGKIKHLRAAKLFEVMANFIPTRLSPQLLLLLIEQPSFSTYVRREALAPFMKAHENLMKRI